MTVTILHNPRCSKSRQTLTLLREQGIEPDIVHYLVSPPDAAAINSILGMLGLEPRELMRKKEAVYKEMRLDNGTQSREELVEAMVRHPILIERPIVLSQGKAALGRPPEAVLDIL